MPLPNEETTPPVTNTNLVIAEGAKRHEREIRIIPHEAPASLICYQILTVFIDTPVIVLHCIMKIKAGKILRPDGMGQLIDFAAAT